MEEAIKDGDLATLKILQKEGCEIGKPPRTANTETTSVAYTPLSLALLLHENDIVEYLLQQGVDVNATNSDGSTALFYASSPGVVQTLIDHGANINATLNERGTLVTPLNNARLAQETEVVKTLLSKGAQDPFSSAVIWFPQCRIQPNGTKAMLYGIAYGKDIKNPFILAIGSNDMDTVRKMVESGTDVNTTDGSVWNSTPLAFAVLRGYTNEVEYLIDHGANLDARNETGTTPLMQALTDVVSSLDTAEMLIAHGANLEIEDSSGCTAIDYATLSHNTNAIEMLETKIKSKKNL